MLHNLTAEEMIKKLRGILAEERTTKRAIAALAGYNETLFSLIMNNRRPMPPDFAARVLGALELHKRAERTAREARRKVLEEASTREN